MKKAELMQEKITEQRKLPKEIKDKLKKASFINLLIAVLIMIYLLAINILYLNGSLTFFTNIAKVFAIILIVIDIILFEIGYRKDNIFIWVYAFELLSCGVLVLSTPYIYTYNSIRIAVMFSPLIFGIYYVVKIILMHVFEKKKYLNNLSDVKELIKYDEEGE